MRYIDADALMEKVGFLEGRVVGVFKRDIEVMPTADVAPVVHGEWILVCANAHHYDISVEEKCSVCGRYVYRYDTQPQDSFCPNCGAKMDGGI